MVYYGIIDRLQCSKDKQEGVRGGDGGRCSGEGADWEDARQWGSFHFGSHMQTLLIYELGFNQDSFTSTFILLRKKVKCSRFPWAKFTNCKCFDMRIEARD